MDEDSIVLREHARAAYSIGQIRQRLDLDSAHTLETCRIAPAHNPIGAGTDLSGDLFLGKEFLPLLADLLF